MQCFIHDQSTIKQSGKDGLLNGKRLAVAIALTALTHGTADAATLRELTYVQVVTNAPLNAQVSAARTVGVRGVRFAIRWTDVEKIPGRFDWAQADSKVRAAKEAGLVPLVTLFGGNTGYRLDPGVAGNTPSSGEALGGFANFAGLAAKRYSAKPSSAPVAYEIWNEPNTKTFWGRPPEPEGYARMASAACRSIKAAVPTSKVLVLGMEGTPVKPPYVVKAYGLDIYREWAARAATPELMSCADGISMHPYLNPPELHYDLEPQLQRFIADHWRKAGQPLVAHTEWGYAIELKRGRTAEDQAALDLRALLIGTGLGRLTNIYQSVDTGIDPSRTDDTFGLVDRGGKIKPAGAAIKRLLDALGEYTAESVGKDPSNAKVYRFKASRGSAKAQVLWTSSGVASVKVAPGGTAIDLVTGAPRAVDGGSVEVSPRPVMLRWGR